MQADPSSWKSGDEAMLQPVMAHTISPRSKMYIDNVVMFEKFTRDEHYLFVRVA